MDGSNSADCVGSCGAVLDLEPPGPFIWALPLPFSSTVPPRISWTAAGHAALFAARSFTDSEICWALALSVCEEANITTKKANRRVMKSA